MDISYRRIDGSKRLRYFQKIVNFYNHYFPKESNELITKNSSLFWIAIKDNKIIGATRILTDGSRYALLLDLIVRKSKRNQGIGKHLVKLATIYCTEKGIKHLILTTDHHHDWLTDFYRKQKFRLVTNQSLMEYIN